MIADTAVLASSVGMSLNGESLFSLPSIYGDSNPDLGFDIDAMAWEYQLERVKRRKEHTNSTECSVASSECSDEQLFENDIEDCLFTSSTYNDFLNTSILNDLDINHVVTEPVTSFPTFEWTSGGLDDDDDDDDNVTTETRDDNDNTPQSDIPSIPNSPRPITKNITKDNRLGNANVTWSQMSDDEQITTIESLSLIISEELGLREQLEVIKIIQPDASISPTDTEFVIDLDDLDDNKLERIRDFVNNNSTSQSSSSSSECSSEPPSPIKKKHSKKLQKERRMQQKELRQRQRKEYRQMMKERRSGLFRKEEVLSLSNCQPDECPPDDLEIDILE